MRSPAVIAASLTVALALGGCSLANKASSKASIPKGASGQIEVIIKDFSSDASNGDASTICTSVFSTQLKNRFNGSGGCTKVVTAALKTIDDFTFTIVGGQVHASTAAIRVQTIVNGKHQTQILDLIKQQHGGWRISSLG